MTSTLLVSQVMILKALTHWMIYHLAKFTDNNEEANHLNLKSFVRKVSMSARVQVYIHPKLYVNTADISSSPHPPPSQTSSI